MGNRWSRWRRVRPAYCFLLPTTLLVVGITFYPALTAIRVSPYDTNYLNLTRFAGLKHYLCFLQDPLGRSNILNSLVHTFGSPAVALPFDMILALLLLAALQTIPEETFEAAKVDGAGAWALLAPATGWTAAPAIAKKWEAEVKGG